MKIIHKTNFNGNDTAIELLETGALLVCTFDEKNQIIMTSLKRTNDVIMYYYEPFVESPYKMVTIDHENNRKEIRFD